MRNFPFFPLLILLLLPALLPVRGIAAASATVKASPQQKNVTAKTSPALIKPAGASALSVVTATGPNQAGYVHYWLITAPDGEQEMQVGIELPDQRIAWSFPGLGVHVTPFIAEGEVEAKDRTFQVKHLYGLRPFNNDTSMRSLRSSLMRRVTPLVRQQVPYCELNGEAPGLCMSCMGFVSQVLFPGRTPEYANFPRNFTRIDGEHYHTTEDLLLYLTGLNTATTDAARKRRLDAIGGPPELQEELARLTAKLAEPPLAVAAAKPPAKRRAAAPKSAIKRPG
jgi:hypothetical protein